jgi:hypothetical protein
MNPSSGSSCPLVPGGIFSRWFRGCTPVIREVINHITEIPLMSPQEMLQESQAELWDTEVVYQKAMFYCASTDPADLCPKAEPREQRGLTLYILASRLQKQKARSNPYMVIFNFIGFFTLVLHDFSPPSAT